MAANSGANVLRYSALFAGIGYGVYHQRHIWQVTQKHHSEAKYDQEVSLIEKAKKEWKEKTNPSSSGVISNPDDPKFDLEAYLLDVAKNSAK